MPTLHLDPLTLAVCGLAGILLGLVELLCGLWRGLRPWARSLGLAGVLGLLAAAGFAAQQPEYFWQPPLALAAVELLLALARAPRTKLARSVWPAVQAVGLIAIGTAVLGWQLYRVDQQLESNMMQTDAVLAELSDPIGSDAAPARMAQTDTGHPVPLYTITLAAATATDTEERYLREQHLSNKVIQTGQADMKYNCHGWVFTGGRYWVRGRQVEGIVKDNGYQAVTRPAAGDLAVFRDAAGEVTHTGLVRTSEAGGPVLIESKWGRLGRFIHTAEEHVYRTHKVTYYHRARGGHVLRDADYPRAGEPVSQHAGL